MNWDPYEWAGLPPPCSLCGVEVQLPGPRRAEEQWTVEVELLSDPDEEFERREVHYRAGKRPGVAAFAMPEGPPAAICRDAAVALGPMRYVVVADGREVTPNWAVGFDANNVPMSQPYSIAVHAACAAIAARVARRPRPGVRLGSMRTLWKVLRTRFDARDNELMGSIDVTGPSMLAHDHNYYLGRRSPASIYALPFDVTDPLNVPELTSKLLLNLKPMDGRPLSDIEKAFQTRFQCLPPELRENVLSFMLGPDGLPAACTRLLSPSAWRDILLEPKLLPFLWDLDADLVRAYDEEKRSQGLVPDWEGLVRQLSVKLSFDNVDKGGHWALDVADGLRNRRRIWQLAEEMYVGDQLPPSFFTPTRQRAPTMPKYWDEDGEPLHPVTRVPCVRVYNDTRKQWE